MWRRRETSTVRAALAVLGLDLVAGSSAAREQLRVRASAELVNIALVRTLDRTEVSGGLADEVGQPIADAEVVLPVALGDGAHATACRAGDRVRTERGDVRATTDGLGFFCIRLPGGVAVDGAGLRYAGDAYHTGASAGVPRETGKRRLSLAFGSRELSASLDAPSFVVSVTARADDPGVLAAPVRLVLLHLPRDDKASGAKESELAATDVQLGTAARFDVETRLLGGPGTGKLVARFLGSGAFAATEESALLVRHATARLSLAAPVQPGDPTEGVEILVAVSSAAGAVPDGLVEATVDGRPAGVATVSAGAARVIATFVPSRGRPSVVMLRYMPSGSAFVAGEPISALAPIKIGSPWPSLPWVLGALSLGYWIVRSWRRPARTDRGSTRPPLVGTRGRATVELVLADRSPSGYRGKVVDAHEGAPVAGARVSIVVPAFDGEGIAASHVAGADGAFSIAHVATAQNEGSRLVVTAPFHATLSGPMPPDGVLTICLVSRRRALLDRLVGWADRAGRPWTRHKEPTPLELAEVARHRERGDVAAWASAVAEAAYGAKPPDERREQDLGAREPTLPTRLDER